MAMHQAVQTKVLIDFLDSYGLSDVVERRLDGWKPAESYLTPPGTKHDDAKEITGDWSVRAGFGGTSLVFTILSGNTFAVTFRTHGCLGMWTLSRTATLEDGVIQLNKAVEPYFGDPFDRLFFVEFSGYLALIPAGSVEWAQRLYESGLHGSRGWIHNLSYRKRPAKL